MLRTRVISAAVLIPVVAVVVWAGEPWISLLLGLVVFLALVELIGLLDAAGFQPPLVATLALGFATAVAGLLAINATNLGGWVGDFLVRVSPPGIGVGSLAASALLLGVVSFTRSDPRAGFVTWSTSTFAVAYLGMLMPFLVFIAHLAPAGGSLATPVGILGLRSGVAWSALLLLTVWGYDIGAYLSGRWLGRTRLVEHISPSKTAEGLGGGLVLATLAAGIGAALVGLAAWHPLVVGPLIGLTAQAGDLAASLIKRAAGRKESGFLIPGHGGILDRVDSLVFAAPVLAGYAVLVAGARA
ncbi:MAG: phosphatidate cytidylyltransferase [Chloroflexota bacterium]|nr:phosphatidate cytidylyltransferase [Chloroflexota bacterium]